MELGQAGGWEAVCRAHLCVLDLEPCPLLGKQGPGGKWASFCRTPQEDPREGVGVPGGKLGPFLLGSGSSWQTPGPQAGSAHLCEHAVCPFS